MNVSVCCSVRQQCTRGATSQKAKNCRIPDARDVALANIRGGSLLLDPRSEIWHYICLVVMGVRLESAITVKGQATIPKAIREHLGLKPGDQVKFFVHPDASIVLLPKLPSSALRGIIKSRRRRPVTMEEMTQAGAEGAASR